MNSDIRLSVSFKGHRKRKRLRLLLGDNATDYLIDLWLTVAQDRPDGVMTGWKTVDIALAAGWEGDAEQFTASLIDCGLLDKADDVYRLHDWEEHQPWACKAKERSEQAHRSAMMRWHPGANDAQRMPRACPPHANSNAQRMPKDENNAPSPSPSPSPSPKENTILSDSARRIFDHWNGQKIVVHRKMTDKQRRRVKSVLETGNTEQEVMQAITNYAEILHGKEYYLKYTWPLEDFLQRGLSKFLLPIDIVRENYRTNENGRKDSRGLPKHYDPTPAYD